MPDTLGIDSDQAPIILEGTPGELRVDANGRYELRHQLNARWVTYMAFDEDGVMRRGVAIPRVPIISDEVIAEGEARTERLDLTAG